LLYIKTIHQEAESHKLKVAAMRLVNSADKEQTANTIA
jgi:hypothetical protein